jgi:hypothetical protein
MAVLKASELAFSPAIISVSIDTWFNRIHANIVFASARAAPLVKGITPSFDAQWAGIARDHLSGGEDAAQVDVDHPLKIRQVIGQEITVHGDPCVIDQHCNGAVILCGFVKHGNELGRVAQIARIGCYCVQCVASRHHTVLVEVSPNNAVAIFCQSFCTSISNASPAPVISTKCLSVHRLSFISKTFFGLRRCDFPRSQVLCCAALCHRSAHPLQPHKNRHHHTRALGFRRGNIALK